MKHKGIFINLGNFWQHEILVSLESTVDSEWNGVINFLFITFGCAAGLCVWSCRFVYIHILYIWPYIYIYMAKKTGCLRSYCLKISCWCNLLLARWVYIINRQKRSLLRQVIRSRKEIGSILLMGREKGPWKNHITVNHALSTCNAMLYECIT